MSEKSGSHSIINEEGTRASAGRVERQQWRISRLVVLISCLVASAYFFGARCISLANVLYNAATIPSDPVEAVLRGAPLIGMSD